ncbi:N-ethylmaleimide reductase [Streptomyces sp. e14]|nr:N-ethylmaleimide reductase [Streptomyces sp. e14]
MLTLTEIAENPLRLARRLKAHDGPELVFRPLTKADTGHLAGFLRALSSASRRFSTFDGYDRAAAQELCDAIARVRPGAALGWGKPLPADGGRHEAERLLAAGADLISLGRPFLANPDLVERLRIGAPINPVRDQGLMYTGGAAGCTDHPTLAATATATAGAGAGDGAGAGAGDDGIRVPERTAL